MKQFFSSHASGWMVLAALLASSGHLAGCDTSAPSKKVASQTTRPDAHETKTSLAPNTDETETQAALSPTPEVQNKDEKDEAKESESKAPLSAPLVKRLIIASDIKEREPVELMDAKVEEPVLAFIELKNAEEDDMGVVVTFEHEDGKKVGFVELTIPGNSPRYRTWARTRNIKTPGEWTAIVTSKSGEELARKTFQVAG